MDIYHLFLVFFVYSFLGWCAEVGYAAFTTHRFVNRGFLNGPVCPIYGVGVSVVLLFLEPFAPHLLLLFAASTLLASLLELLTGWALDKLFHNKWWDYSNKRFNLGGYICLSFSLLWGVVCTFIVRFFHPAVLYILNLLPHMLGIALILVMSAALLADLYVTVSAILKFNRTLAGMQKIAQELHEISDQLGEDIYEKTTSAMKKHDDLKAHYLELLQERGRVIDRLVKAFPQMQSRHYHEQLTELKNHLNERLKK